jgi:molecular chaperone GrpE
MSKAKQKEENKGKEMQNETTEDSLDSRAEENAKAGSDEEAVQTESAQTEAAENAETKYLRLAADFQNYKRRMEKERFERYTEGKKDFAEDLLPVLDIFDVALAQNAELAKDDHDRAVIEGMEMILKQFQEALAKNGVSEIEALGLDFDPNFHHAVIMEPSDQYESQKVSEVLQKGYRIGEKVIRPSMVKVAE